MTGIVEGKSHDKGGEETTRNEPMFLWALTKHSIEFDFITDEERDSQFPVESL